MLDERSVEGTPSDEAGRWQALRRSGLLESGTDLMLDAVVHRAAMLFNVPIAAVGLRDGARHAFRSSIGLGLPFTSADLAFCGHAIVGKQPFFLLNAQFDSRFATNAVVHGRPGIRFYAGAPVYGAEGRLLGALCVMDRRARLHVTPEELAALSALAADAAGIFATSAIQIKPERSW